MIYAKYWRYAVPTLTGIVTDNLSWIKVAGEKSEKDNAITFHESIEPCNTTMRLFEPHVLSAKVFRFFPSGDQQETSCPGGCSRRFRQSG